MLLPESTGERHIAKNWTMNRASRCSLCKKKMGRRRWSLEGWVHRFPRCKSPSLGLLHKSCDQYLQNRAMHPFLQTRSMSRPWPRKPPSKQFWEFWCPYLLRLTAPRHPQDALPKTLTHHTPDTYNAGLPTSTFILSHNYKTKTSANTLNMRKKHYRNQTPLLLYFFGLRIHQDGQINCQMIKYLLSVTKYFTEIITWGLIQYSYHNIGAWFVKRVLIASSTSWPFYDLTWRSAYVTTN